MTFSKTDLDAAIAQLSICARFPGDEAARAAIQLLLARMCPSREALDWLVLEFVNRIGEWRGPVELRGVLCTRYRPQDGIEATCSIPGYRPEDGEARAYDRHLQLKAGGLTDERELRKLCDSEGLRLLEGGKGLPR